MQYLSGSGRIGRLRYLGTGLVLGFGAFMAVAIGSTIDGDGGPGAGLILGLIGIAACVWMSIASAIRRLHDLGMTGLLVLVTLIPLVGSLFQLFLLLAPGDDGPNRFGPPFGGQPQLSLAEHRVQAAQIRAEAAEAYAQRQG